MKGSDRMRNSRSLIIPGVVLIALACLSWKSNASSVSTAVNLVNNSSKAIRNLYTSQVGSEDWGANILNNTIPAGQSSNLSNITCDSQELTVIAEDQDGCFLSTVITCGQNSTWTVTNETSRDCGTP
jgi:hypothetical protein